MANSKLQGSQAAQDKKLKLILSIVTGVVIVGLIGTAAALSINKRISTSQALLQRLQPFLRAHLKHHLNTHMEFLTEQIQRLLSWNCGKTSNALHATLSSALMVQIFARWLKMARFI